MTPLEIVKFIHLIVAISLFGLCIASCYYMRIAQKSGSPELCKYTLNQTIRLDLWLIFPLMLLTFVLGTEMVHLSGLSIHIAWVKNAYLFLGINFVCWFLSTCIRLNNRNDLTQFKSASRHLLLQLISIALFIIIAHDAITQSTWIGN